MLEAQFDPSLPVYRAAGGALRLHTLSQWSDGHHRGGHVGRSQRASHTRHIAITIRCLSSLASASPHNCTSLESPALKEDDECHGSARGTLSVKATAARARNPVRPTRHAWTSRHSAFAKPRSGRGWRIGVSLCTATGLGAAPLARHVLTLADRPLRCHRICDGVAATAPSNSLRWSRCLRRARRVI